MEYRVDNGANVHCVVGKLSFDEDKLLENIEALMRKIRAEKPSAAKGLFLKNVTLSATNSPGIDVAV